MSFEFELPCDVWKRCTGQQIDGHGGRGVAGSAQGGLGAGTLVTAPGLGWVTCGTEPVQETGGVTGEAEGSGGQRAKRRGAFEGGSCRRFQVQSPAKRDWIESLLSGGLSSLPLLRNELPHGPCRIRALGTGGWLRFSGRDSSSSCSVSRELERLSRGWRILVQDDT